MKKLNIIQIALIALLMFTVATTAVYAASKCTVWSYAVDANDSAVNTSMMWGICGDTGQARNCTNKGAGLLCNFMFGNIMDSENCTDLCSWVYVNATGLAPNYVYGSINNSSLRSDGNIQLQNITIETDATAPNVTTVYPNGINWTTSYTVTFIYNVTDYGGILNCSLYINDTLNQSNSTITRSTNQTFSTTFHYLNNSHNFTWYVNCTDNVSNIGKSNLGSIFLNVPNQPPSFTTPVRDYTESSMVPSNVTYPTNDNDTVLFNGTATDVDTATWRLIVCNSTALNATQSGCNVTQICAGPYVSSGSWSNCTHAVAGETWRNRSWYAFACDANNCSDYNDTFSPYFVNHRPTIGNVTVNDTTPAVNNSLTCVNGTFADTDGDSENTSARLWKWYNNSVYTGIATNTLDLASNGFKKGDVLGCAERVADEHIYYSADYNNSTTNATIANTAPTLTSVTISPSPTAVYTGALTCTPVGAYDPDVADTLTYNYTWFKNSTQNQSTGYIASTSATLGKNNTSIGDYWNCTVMVFDATAKSALRYSSNTTIVNATVFNVTLVANNTTRTVFTRQNATYLINLTNTGNQIDNYTVNITNSHSADTALVNGSSSGLRVMSVNPGAITTLLVIVGNESASTYNVTIAAVSDGNSTTGNNSTVLTTIVQADTSSPTYNTFGSNSGQVNLTGQTITLHANWTDNAGLDKYIFYWNVTTSWAANSSATAFAGTPGWSNVTRTIGTATYEGRTVAFRFWANDTYSNTNQTTNTTFTILSQAPIWNLNGSNATTVNESGFVTVWANWSDNFNINNTWLSHNKSGSWANSSQGAVGSTSNNSSFSINTSGFAGNLGWRVCANDSVSNVNCTGINIINVTDLNNPLVTVITCNPAVVNQSVSVYCNATVTDGVAVNTVQANLTFPGGSINTTTASNSSSTYYFTFPTTNESGIYNVTWIATDTYGNQNTTEKTSFNVSYGVSSVALNTTANANYTYNSSFMLNATISADSGDIGGCNATITITNESRINTSASHTLDISNTTNGSATNATWLMNTSQLGDVNITVVVACVHGTGSNDTAYNITVQDLTAPAVTWVSSSSTYRTTGQNITVSVNVTDSFTIDTVWAGNSTNDSVGTLSNVTATTYNGTANVTETTDGVYTYRVSANDTSGNLNNSVTFSVTVDNTAPVASGQAIDNSTSNNAYIMSGNNTTFRVNLTDYRINLSSVTIEVMNASQSGTTMKTYNSSLMNCSYIAVVSGKNVTQCNITWNGTNTAGANVSDGNYYYRVNASDNLSNSGSNTYTTHFVNVDNSMQRITALTVAYPGSQTKAKNTDVIVINVTGEDAGGISLTNATINDSALGGAALAQMTNKTGNMWYTNITVNVTGSDGTYQLNVSVTGPSGAESSYRAVEIDNTDPTVSIVSVIPVYISPNGDSIFDEANITFNTTENIIYVVNIYNSSGDFIKNATGVVAVNATASFSWNGTNQSGGIYVRNGTYYANVTGTDVAGNTGTSSTRTIVVDTAPPVVDTPYPAANATGIPVATTVYAVFNKSMLLSSFNNTTFMVNKTDGTHVEGTFSVSTTTIANDTIRFTPSSALSYNTNYNVNLTTNSRSLAGNTMAYQYNWTFRTTVGGGGGGGGGGAGGSVSMLTGPVVTIQMSAGDTALFTLNGEPHTILMDKVTEKSVIMKISSEEQTVHLDLHETKKVDVNNDGAYDLSATLDSVSEEGIATVTFHLSAGDTSLEAVEIEEEIITPSVVEEGAVAEVSEVVIEEEVPVAGFPTWVIIVAVFVLLLVGLFVWNYSKK